MDSLDRLEEIFSHFPGIGPRQARRFAHYILNKPASFSHQLAELLKKVRDLAIECPNCNRMYMDSGEKKAKDIPCPICQNPSRDHQTLMITARDSDFETIEKSGAYRGLYFILGGTVPILDKEPEKRIRLRKLLEYISSLSDLKEIILSLNTTPDGEHTANIVKNSLEKMTTTAGRMITISVLGRGLSTGAELEYADKETIRNALSSRQ
ncbi:MAG: hypothetical protein A3B11_01910 [Candidatus Taylorbacteria bacterium RIFCSPLOWO2_01_FULL_44_26]|uniref:Recombination protein RecR n=2 Tax=Candidatus Tayloriibacteriota TaxID=1817919 RepID=A0A1G2MJB2_9BACT|nr:MAG: hypothetical protein A3D50_01985 [Candidatus Taylorbacteria bacterium RIFCSPHIGHO2_02_FULL_44_12]OHA31429.1 MAG: hypothetical protein A3B11_01910 [Candidatus Taylorbacteria bacterium RIFCSPLOWO2_01_FULL_44_26]